MAELATIARPYAEALLKAGGDAASAAELTALAAVASHEQLLAFADNPKVTPAQVIEVIASVLNAPLSPKVGNLLAAVLDNGRLSALSEVARQFQQLINARSGVSDAEIHSAFEMSDAQVAEVKGAEQILRKEVNADVHAELLGRLKAEL